MVENLLSDQFIHFLQLRLNSYGHIIGTEYLSDLVEKEHTDDKHGNVIMSTPQRIYYIGYIIKFYSSC